MNRITTDDLHELTIRNVKKLGFDVSKLASSMSKHVSTALFKTNNADGAPQPESLRAVASPARRQSVFL